MGAGLKYRLGIAKAPTEHTKNGIVDPYTLKLCHMIHGYHLHWCGPVLGEDWYCDRLRCYGSPRISPRVCYCGCPRPEIRLAATGFSRTDVRYAPTRWQCRMQSLDEVKSAMAYGYWPTRAVLDLRY